MSEEAKTHEAAVCATCAQPLQGAYCSHCGEKKLDKHDHRIVNIFEEMLHSLTHADSKFLRSLKYLFTKPGFLTNEYLAGRRKRYSSPLSLFFIANLIYLLAAPIDTFNSHFEVVAQGQPYSQSLTPQINAKLQNKHWTREQLAERYDEKSGHEAKLLLIVFVFLLSLPAALLFISKKRYYYDYVIFSMEYFNFIMYGLMLLIPWLVILGAYVVHFIRSGPVNLDFNGYLLYGIILAVLWSYLTIATRRVFRQQWWLTIAKAGVLTVCTVLAMFLYRFIAFEVILFLL
jgi:hypothetical protein